MKNLYISICLLFIAVTSIAQSVPAPAPTQSNSILIMNAKVHVGNGNVIENAVVGFEDGKFTLVADAKLVRIDMTKYKEVIDASGMELYPGFIATNSTLGLHEIDAVRAMDDVAEVGTYKPSVRSVIAFNTESEIIPTVRSNGVLMGQICPRGGVISGASSVMQFDAWNWEDAVVREDDGLHLNWPQVYHKHYDKKKMTIEKVKSYDQQLTEIQIFFKEAKAYLSVKNPPLTEVRFEGMRGIFDGGKTLYVHADEVRAIKEALRFKEEMGIPKMVIIGGYDAWMIAEELKRAQVGVMLCRVHSLPQLEGDDVDLPYKLASLLHKSGVVFSLQNEGDMERMGTRNLPFHAGTAVAHGLPYEEAVKALTLAPAQLLGIDATCGSIETGKDATFFVSKGDALDMLGNQLTHAFIQGRKIDLSNKQVGLYERYLKK